jgi:hypothetical protein
MDFLLRVRIYDIAKRIRRNGGTKIIRQLLLLRSATPAQESDSDEQTTGEHAVGVLCLAS